MSYYQYELGRQLINTQFGQHDFTGKEFAKSLLDNRIAANTYEVDQIASLLLSCGQIKARDPIQKRFDRSSAQYYQYHNVAPSAPVDDRRTRPEGLLYDLVIIGGGYAGISAGVRAQALGLHSALIYERRCQYDTVIQKLRERSARASTNRASTPVIEVSDVIPTVSSDVNLNELHQIGCDLYPGSARFTSMNTVNIGDTQLHFRKAVIATGATRTAPLMAQLDDLVLHCSEKDVVVIIGSSRCGRSLELSCLMSKICSRVILLCEEKNLIAGLDSCYSERIKSLLSQSRVHLIFISKFVRISDSESHPERVQVSALYLDEKGERRSVRGNYIINLRDNRPNVMNLDLDRAGVRYSEMGAIQVDDFYFTSNRNICAVGDCITSRLYRSWQLAQFQGRDAVTNSFIRLRRFSKVTVPVVIDTIPKIAQLHSISPTSTEPEIERYQEPIEGGFIEIVIDASTGKFISAFALGAQADLLIMALAGLLPKSGNLARLALIAPVQQASSIYNIARRIQSSRYSPYRSLLRRIYRKLIRIIY